MYLHVIFQIGFLKKNWLMLQKDDCDQLLEHLLCMLQKDVPTNWKTCAQYIWLLNSYAKLVSRVDFMIVICCR